MWDDPPIRSNLMFLPLFLGNFIRNFGIFLPENLFLVRVKFRLPRIEFSGLFSSRFSDPKFRSNFWAFWPLSKFGHFPNFAYFPYFTFKWPFWSNKNNFCFMVDVNKKYYVMYLLLPFFYKLPSSYSGCSTQLYK